MTHQTRPTTRPGNVAAEIDALKTAAGMADRSPAGRLQISGPDALDLLNRLTTNKLDELPPGEGLLTVLTNGDARVIDLLALGATGDGMLCLTSPGQAQAVIDWIDTYTFGEEITVEDISESTFQLTVGGPSAPAALAAAGAGVDGLSRDELRATRIGGAGVTLWRMLAGSGADGYEVIGDTGDTGAVREALEAAGVMTVSGEAWELYRIANGMPAFGAEFGLFNNPLEARLAGAISEDKGCYTGQEIIARLQTYKKVQRKLMAVGLSGAAAPGEKLVVDGANAGLLTSVAESPDGTFAGLALVSAKAAAAGAVLDVTSEDGAPHISATLAEPAFALATEPAEE